jgi:glycosyltransferase involved in cell wall biosynthesis
VHLHGYISDAVRRDLFAHAAVLVLPSWNEGFGLPALEAMAAGVPVVASNRGALPEVVADAGLLVDPASADEIAAAVERVLDDSTLAADLAARGRARALTFSWAAAADRLRGLYRYAVDLKADRHARRG